MCLQILEDIWAWPTDFEQINHNFINHLLFFTEKEYSKQSIKAVNIAK